MLPSRPMRIWKFLYKEVQGWVAIIISGSPVITSFFQVTFWFPKWMVTNNPWKGHLKHKKPKKGHNRKNLAGDFNFSMRDSLDYPCKWRCFFSSIPPDPLRTNWWKGDNLWGILSCMEFFHDYFNFLRSMGVETNGYNKGLIRPYFWGGYIRGVGWLAII